MEKNSSEAYLVNTGWIGGAYGVGERIDLPATRKIIDAILDGSIEKAEFETVPCFNLRIPKALNGIDSKIFNPRNLWKYPKDWDEAAISLAKKFINNFKHFTDNPEGQRLVDAGPRIN